LESPREEKSKMTTFGAAVWEGGIRDGKGAVSTKSGALDKYPYGFASRRSYYKAK
jgi:hypothetical protein